MNKAHKANSKRPRPYWFVNGTDDQTKRFIEEGIWENESHSKNIGEIKSIQPGDRIAIKSTYVQKKGEDLPFDNRGRNVSVMAIKAIGTVKKNLHNDFRLEVEWENIGDPRKWYFYTSPRTIWKVSPDTGRWEKDALIKFTFEKGEQDIDRFRNDSYWRDRFGDNTVAELPKDVGISEKEATPKKEITAEAIGGYSIQDILDDGCFLAEEKLKKILERLQSKKNLILQGPPGTGKTWLAKRLAFALMGQNDKGKLRVVQFHPNLSYEDFIRGWRPTGDGKLSLVDGPFIEMIKTAEECPESPHVIVIEEINRGNPAQIFGEMLTLLEVGKRTPDEAMELSYKRSDSERVFIPDNLYVIGTMNIADRSLALVDLALRRRFAFIDLEPIFGEPWHNWLELNFEVDRKILTEIEKRIISLNDEISSDISLGPQFRVGHSYVTPPPGVLIDDVREWFRQVVNTEIGPLLDEYWFDGIKKSQMAKEKLLKGL